MSTNDEVSEVAVGWEVWLLLALLAGGGVAGLLVFSFVGGGIESFPTGSAPASLALPSTEPARAAAGLADSAILAGIAALVARAGRHRGPARVGDVDAAGNREGSFRD